MRRATSRIAIVAALLACAWPAAAGQRTAEVLWSNFTPDGQGGQASRQCVKALEKKLTEGDTKLHRLGETAMRKLVGKSRDEAFLSWSADVYRPAKAATSERQEAIDTIVLVDCRPAAQQLDVVIVPPSHGVVRISLRGVPIDDAATQIVGEAIERRAWADFQP